MIAGPTGRAAALSRIGQFGYRQVRLWTKRPRRLVGWRVALRLLCFVWNHFVDPLLNLLFGFRLRRAIAFFDLSSKELSFTFGSPSHAKYVHTTLVSSSLEGADS